MLLITCVYEISVITYGYEMSVITYVVEILVIIYVYEISLITYGLIWDVSYYLCVWDGLCCWSSGFRYVDLLSVAGSWRYCRLPYWPQNYVSPETMKSTPPTFFCLNANFTICSS